jgi:alpha-glucoside transport system permease protein
MDNIVGKKSGLTWAVHVSTALLVLLWVIPTFGLFVSSFRTGDQIVGSGWWRALSTQEQQLSPIRVGGEAVERDGLFVIEGNLFTNAGTVVSAWGTNVNRPTEFAPGRA